MTPAPHTRDLPAASPHPSRRWFLAGGAAVLLGAGAGAAGGLLWTNRDEHRTPHPPPPVLLAAARTEQTLIADLDASTGGSAAVRAAIAQVRADHAAHLAALRGLLRGYDPPAPSGSRSAGATPSPAGSARQVLPAPPRGTPQTTAQLRTAETRAAATADTRAARSAGQLAVLLASVAACEAGHAELLSELP